MRIFLIQGKTKTDWFLSLVIFVIFQLSKIILVNYYPLELNASLTGLKMYDKFNQLETRPERTYQRQSINYLWQHAATTVSVKTNRNRYFSRLLDVASLRINFSDQLMLLFCISQWTCKILSFVKKSTSDLSTSLILSCEILSAA